MLWEERVQAGLYTALILYDDERLRADVPMRLSRQAGKGTISPDTNQPYALHA